MNKEDAKKRLTACGKYISLDFQKVELLKLIAELLIQDLPSKE
jgi:hypothetical protein